MSTLLPLLLFGLSGVLVGGAWSLHRQRAGAVAVTVAGVLAALALAGGLLWLEPW